jgi:hypothetical protein
MVAIGEGVFFAALKEATVIIKFPLHYGLQWAENRQSGCAWLRPYFTSIVLAQKSILML